MNRSSTPNRNRLTPRSTSSAPRVQVPKSPRRVAGQDDLFLEQKLRHNRQKLTHTLDTYTMLIHSNNPIRCLQHNSVVSVFCQSDNRLLCTNCMLGKVQHKFHKMIPIDKSQSVLRERLSKMHQSVEKQAKVIGDTSALILKNLLQEQTEAHKTLNSLTIKFRQVHTLLDNWFQNIKLSMIDGLRDVQIKYQTVAIQLNRLKDVYIAHTSPHLETHRNSTLQNLLYRHVVLRTINQQNKFENASQSFPEPKFRSIGHSQLIKITQIFDQLSKYQANQCFK